MKLLWLVAFYTGVSGLWIMPEQRNLISEVNWFCACAQFWAVFLKLLTMMNSST